MRIRTFITSQIAAVLLLALTLQPAPLSAQRISMNFQNAYSSGQTYQKGDTVSSSGTSYVSIVSNNTGNDPASNPSSWTNLGAPPAAFTGPWSSATAYTVGSVAGYGGSSFAALLGNTNVTPPATCVSNSTWTCIASGGVAVLPSATAIRQLPGYTTVGAGNTSPFAPEDVTSPVQSSLAYYAGLAPRTVIAMPLTGNSGLNAYGDSIMCGTGAAGSGCSTVGMANIIATATGTTGNFHNYAVQGQNTCQIAYQAFAADNPSAGDGILRIAQPGMNDWSYKVFSRAQARVCRLAMLTYLGTTSNKRQTGATLGSLPTNWSLDTSTFPSGANNGIYTTTDAAVASIPTLTTVPLNSFVFVHYMIYDSNSSEATMTIGGEQVSISSAAYPITSSFGGSAAGVGVVAFYYNDGLSHNIAAQPHLPTAGDRAEILDVVIEPGNTTDARVWMGGVSYPTHDNWVQASQMAQLSINYKQAKDDVQTTAGWHLNSYFVPTRNCMKGTTAEMYQALNPHPNLLGHQELAACYLNGETAVLPDVETINDITTPGAGANNSYLTGATTGDVWPSTQAAGAGTSYTAGFQFHYAPTVGVLDKLTYLTNHSTASQTITASLYGSASGSAINYVMKPGESCLVGQTFTAQFLDLFGCGPADPLQFKNIGNLGSGTINVQNQVFTVGNTTAQTINYPATTFASGKCLIFWNINTAVITMAGSSIASANIPLNTNDAMMVCNSGVANAWQPLWHTNSTIFPKPGINIPNGTAVLAATGTGVTSMACAASYTCTNTRGRVTLVGGTGTTGTMGTITFSGTLSAIPTCRIYEVGTATLHGLDHAVPTTSACTVTAALTVAGATVTFEYDVMP